jgi:hypothetical protein
LRTSPFSSLWMERKSRERDREEEEGRILWFMFIYRVIGV